MHEEFHLPQGDKENFILENIVRRSQLSLDQVLELADQYNNDLIIDLLAQAASKKKAEEYFQKLTEYALGSPENGVDKFIKNLYKQL